MGRNISDISRRRFLKTLAATTIVGVYAGTMFGCTPNASTSGSASTSASASGTRTIVDDAGRTVEIPAVVNTAAGSGFGARAIVYAGAIDKLVGVSETDKKISVSLPYAMLNAATFNALPAVCSGGMNNTVFEEEMVKLAPDVIISTSTDPSVDDELQKKLNIPVITVHMNNYDIFEDKYYQSLAMLGEVFGTTSHTDEVIAAMKEWQKDLANRSAGVSDADKPTVYIGGVSYRGPHGIEGTYGGYGPFDAVAAKNVVDETGKTGPFSVDLEQISAWDPDFLFLNPENMSQVNEEFANNPAFFDTLKAVQNGKVYSQPAYIAYGTNYELAIANAYFVGKTIYPDQFKDIDIEKKADEIFEKTLGGPFISTMKEAGVTFGPITIGE